jgi:transcription elongation GreA/GreB family factor
MMREKINKLYVLLGKEHTNAQKVADKVKNAANEIAKASYNSPSQSGDRFHSQGQADIAKERVERFEKAFARVEKELENKIPESISPICWVNLEYKDATKDGFYYVDEPLSVPGYKFVSSGSPFGNILKDKMVEDNFKYSITGNERSGKVVSIE